MIKAIIFYFQTSLRNSRFFYFFCLLGIFLLYYQTFGLDINVSNNIKIEGLWINGEGDSLNYIKHIGLHYILFFLFGFVLLTNITSSFFSTEYLEFVLTKEGDRNKILTAYIIVLCLMIFIFYCVHILLLNALLFFITTDLFFLPSLKTILFVAPLLLFFSVVVTSFSIIFKNKLTNITVIYSYLFGVPFFLELILNLDYNLPVTLEKIANYNEWYLPFFSIYLSDIFKYSFGMGVFSFWQGYLLMICLFLLTGLIFFNRKIY